MLLLALPNELLLLVLEFVGAEALRRDLGMLTICRGWREAAEKVLLQDAKLSAKRFRLFPPPSVATSSRLQTELHRLAVEVDLMDSPDVPNMFSVSAHTPPRLCVSILLTLTLQTFWLDWQPRDQHMRLVVPGFLVGCPNFRALEVHIRLKSIEGLMPMLHLSAATAFLGPRPFPHLVELTITSAAPMDSSNHLCVPLVRHLASPTLQRLHLDLPSLCPEIIENAANQGGGTALRELAIWLNRRDPGTPASVIDQTTCGAGAFNTPAGSHAMRLERAVSLLLAQAPGLRRARYLGRIADRSGVLAMDCATLAWTYLRAGLTWNAEGVDWAELSAEGD